MNAAQIRRILVKPYLSSSFLCWVVVRFISSSGSLFTIYLYALGIRYLENGFIFPDVVKIFGTYTCIVIATNIIRPSSKQGMNYASEKNLINIQKILIRSSDPKGARRKELVQSLFNLSEGVRVFVTFLGDGGIPAVLHLTSIPIILYFVDSKILIYLIAFIVVYVGISYYFSGIYKDYFVSYDKAREQYLSVMIESDDILKEAKNLIHKIKHLMITVSFTWVSVQNIGAVFQFVVIVTVVLDIFNGTKQISDLVLVVGYTAMYHTYLNQVTKFLQSVMQIRAGVTRFERISRSVHPDSVVLGS